MSRPTNPIRDMVKATVLPQQIWPSRARLSTPKLQGRGYTLSGDYLPHVGDFDAPYWDWIRIHEKTIAALQHLPAAQVLGQATLVRTPTQLTAMISIAEAASASMAQEYCQLLWVMVKLIEKTLGFGGAGGYQYLRWELEISEAEHVSNILEKVCKDREDDLEWRKLKRQIKDRKGKDREQMDSQGEALEGDLAGLLLQIKEVKAQQQTLQDELEAAKQQNKEILRLLRATSSWKTTDKSRRKHYSTHSTMLGARKKDGQWFLCVYRGDDQSQAFPFLLDWLEAQLGGTNFKASTGHLEIIRLKCSENAKC
jgi:hypothetical protein